jgi:hypothetical protein
MARQVDGEGACTADIGELHVVGQALLVVGEILEVPGVDLKRPRSDQ